MVVDLEHNESVERSPPAEEVFEQLTRFDQRIKALAACLGVVRCDRSQDRGLDFHGWSVGWSFVTRDLIEEDEVELLAVRECLRAVGHRPDQQPPVEPSIS